MHNVVTSEFALGLVLKTEFLGALSTLLTHVFAGCARRNVAGELRFRGDRHVDVVLRVSLACARIGRAYALH
jgi:hypothetical protein